MSRSSCPRAVGPGRCGKWELIDSGRAIVENEANVSITSFPTLQRPNPVWEGGGDQCPNVARVRREV